jgi:hypothetical protein
MTSFRVPDEHRRDLPPAVPPRGPREARQDLSEEEPVGLAAPPAAITGGHNDYGKIVEVAGNLA